MRTILYSIDGTKQINDRLFVAGRCCESEIRIGDFFTEIVSTSRNSNNPHELDYLTKSVCNLEVVAILTYGSYINILEPGMTGEIELKFKFPIKYQIGLYLYGHPNNEPFEDFEILGKGEFHVKKTNM